MGISFIPEGQPTATIYQTVMANVMMSFKDGIYFDQGCQDM
jgi:hypothetical protein